MCRRLTCRTCGKPTWAGCGAHVEQVLGDVRPADRCPGHPRRARPAANPSAAPKRSLLSRFSKRT